MSDELIEYRVRPVTRYIVTRFERSGNGGSVCGGGGRGEYDNYDTAYEVAYALAKSDHERKGWRIGDPRIQYPRHEEFGASIDPSQVHERRMSVCTSSSRTGGWAISRWEAMKYPIAGA